MGTFIGDSRKSLENCHSKTSLRKILVSSCCLMTICFQKCKGLLQVRPKSFSLVKLIGCNSDSYKSSSWEISM